MKVKELKRTVNVCWSPAEHYPVTIAAGSAAQQVDASFSSSSHLDLYTLNLEEPGLDLSLKSSLQTQHKFQKIVWSGAGVIVGGCDGGLLEFYNTEKLLNNATDALVGSSTKHNGNVSSLDINPYQKNLLASGASDSEIFIWDLNNTSQPMAPGNKSQPYEHVQGLAWNQQVQHIIGSTFASRCVVWDLRKNEPIMKLSDVQSRTRWRSLSWHPSVATQLCIASEDDQVPVVQLWDLRLASAPLVTLEGHHKGVMSLSWCKQDPDLLLSAGKDGRVLCWNPNNTKPGGELLSEISEGQQWVFEVAWCPRDPSLFVSASFDQQLTVHALLARENSPVNTQSQSNIMDSFGGADSLGALPAVSRVVPPPAAQTHQLPRPPNWLKRPITAKFSFGGKLVISEKCPQEAGSQKLVYISQVISEPEIVEKSTELDTVLGSSLSQESDATERLAEYCRQKGDSSSDQNTRYTWFFLRANFLPNFRSEVLNLLGFKQDEIPSKFKNTNLLAGEGLQHDVSALSRGESTETEAELSTDTSTDLSDAHTLIERKLANIELGDSLGTNVVIPNGEDSTSLICRALVCGNLEEAVELCLDAKRIADALIIASLGSQELLYKVQKYHLSSSSQDPVALVAGSLLMSRWDLLVTSAAPLSWRDTLAAIVTHCEGEALAHYCEMLGDKLCKESEPSLSQAATICYLCAMSPEALVARWGRAPRSDVRALAALTELALVARRAALSRGRPVPAGGKLESVVNEYASRLASQGCLQSALNTLEGIQHTELRDRLLYALGLVQQQQQQPRRPSHAQTPQSRLGATHAHRRGHVAHADPAYGNVPSQYDQPWQQSSVTAPQPSYTRGGLPQPQQPLQPLQPIQPAPLQPIQPPQPSRPASVGPTSAGGITSRSKYKVDPSVQSAPSYNQYSFNNQVPSQPYGGYNSPLPEQFNNTSVPAYNSGTSVPGQMNQMPGLMNPGQMNSSQMNPGQMNSTVNGGYYNPVQAAPEPVAPPVPSKPMAPGWNDPPMMSSKPRPKPEVTSQAPITHPLFGVEPPQHVPLAPVAQYPGQQQQNPGQQQQFPGQQQQFPGQQQQFPGQQQQFPGQQQQFPGQQYGQQQYGQYQEPYAATPAYPQQTESPAPVEPVPVQKAALPDQHLVLQTVFDSLRIECVNRATNPQMKRKLEDVQRRLETLYDMLREYKLSESACTCLHSCCQYVQAGNHEAALQLSTALASGTDFAAAASFLPGLKVLFQLAAQLQVYLR